MDFMIVTQFAFINSRAGEDGWRHLERAPVVQLVRAPLPFSLAVGQRRTCAPVEARAGALPAAARGRTLVAAKGRLLRVGASLGSRAGAAPRPPALLVCRGTAPRTTPDGRVVPPCAAVSRQDQAQGGRLCRFILVLVWCALKFR